MDRTPGALGLGAPPSPTSLDADSKRSAHGLGENTAPTAKNVENCVVTRAPVSPNSPPPVSFRPGASASITDLDLDSGDCKHSSLLPSPSPVHKAAKVARSTLPPPPQVPDLDDSYICDPLAMHLALTNLHGPRFFEDVQYFMDGGWTGAQVDPLEALVEPLLYCGERPLFLEEVAEAEGNEGDEGDVVPDGLSRLIDVDTDGAEALEEAEGDEGDEGDESEYDYFDFDTVSVAEYANLMVTERLAEYKKWSNTKIYQFALVYPWCADPAIYKYNKKGTEVGLVDSTLLVDTYEILKGLSITSLDLDDAFPYVEDLNSSNRYPKKKWHQWGHGYYDTVPENMLFYTNTANTVYSKTATTAQTAEQCAVLLKQVNGLDTELQTRPVTLYGDKAEDANTALIIAYVMKTLNKTCEEAQCFVNIQCYRAYIRQEHQDLLREFEGYLKALPKDDEKK